MKITARRTTSPTCETVKEFNNVDSLEVQVGGTVYFLMPLFGTKGGLDTTSSAAMSVVPISTLECGIKVEDHERSDCAAQ